MSVSAMKQALDLLETSWGCGDQDTLKYWNETAQVLRQAIAEAEKPWVKTYAGGKPNYTTPVHASDMSEKHVQESDKDRHEFEEMVKKGTKAWAGTPDNWVDDLRGGVEKQDPDDDIYDIWVEQEIKEKNVPQS